MCQIVYCLLPRAQLHIAYIVQGHRFDIFEQVGCYPHVVNTLPSYFLVAMWPLVIGFISAVYCGGFPFPRKATSNLTSPIAGLTVWSFLQRRAQFSQFMTSNSSLTMSRYLRLMALASVELLCATPLAIFQIALNVTSQPLEPWISWEETHYNFSRVRLIPAVIWKMDHWFVVGVQLSRWSPPLCAFIFFAFFGFAAEARKNYYNAASKVLVVCRLKCDPASSPKSSSRLDTLLQFNFYPLTWSQSPKAHPRVVIHIHDVSYTPCVHTSSTPLPTFDSCHNPYLPQ